MTSMERFAIAERIPPCLERATDVSHLPCSSYYRLLSSELPNSPDMSINLSVALSLEALAEVVDLSGHRSITHAAVKALFNHRVTYYSSSEFSATRSSN